MTLRQIILSSLLVIITVVGFNLTSLSNKTSAASFCDNIVILKPLCSESGQNGSGPENNDIWKLLVKAINILTDGIIVVAIGGFIYAGVLYSSAGGNQDNIKKAKDIMQNIVMGLLAYAAMYSLLNFIIPGGMF
jgi:hypothetical protein